MDDYDPFQLPKEPSRKQVVNYYEGVPYYSVAHTVPTVYFTAGRSTYDGIKGPSTTYG